MPVTTSYPDTTGFAHYLYPNPSQCRDTGYLCKTNSDNLINLDRMGYTPIKYMEINQKHQPSKDFTISSYSADGYYPEKK
jgi:hypothetical protein